MSSREFVDPVHKNVDVLTFSVASRVILDMNIAKGIEVKRFGKTLEYFACNEVILSAGAIGSPQGLNPLYNVYLTKFSLRQGRCSPNPFYTSFGEVCWIHSQILMLSGIGPKEELLRHGIRPVIDLPVGQNLQDHCSVLTPLKIGKPEGLQGGNSIHFQQTFQWTFQWSFARTTGCPTVL